MDLRVDPFREGWDNSAGILVRAQAPSGAWISADITELDAASLLTWLKSRGGDNPWAEDIVGILLGHGHLHKLTGGNKDGE